MNKDIDRRDSWSHSVQFFLGGMGWHKSARHANLLSNAGFPLLCLQLRQEFAIWRYLFEQCLGHMAINKCFVVISDLPRFLYLIQHQRKMSENGPSFHWKINVSQVSEGAEIFPYGKSPRNNVTGIFCLLCVSIQSAEVQSFSTYNT